ncbi:hypothetical protein MOO44_02775 [Nicoliella spurrieriana]|uniref:dextransucrase n=1 Tax=Nicoliella spurrieriana TaxID=2925830 RepID=A0A976RSJ5_9LACO|nr:glycoside hydrolase family 70 protein [Nicoliella spurrieriana]UQS87102.1 hypothetical protein MOO44_02775 [Nicoliella spurrieriana]
MKLNHQLKMHYKIYKNSQKWAAATVIATALGAGYQFLGAQPKVFADEQTETTATIPTSASIDSSVVSQSSSIAEPINSAASSSAGSIVAASSNSSTGISLASSLAGDNRSSSAQQFNSQADVNLSKLTDQDKNIKKINDNYYYYQDGEKQTGFAVQVGKQILYFNKKTGALVKSDQKQFQYGKVSLNNELSKHNSFASVDSNSVTTTDGYMTADTWYRPKDILVDGKQWMPSSSTDMRPLLMAWWPDKQTEVNYLSYMNQHGFGPSYELHAASDDQSDLNDAAYQVQRDIERKITTTKNVQWLHDLISNFVNQQPLWNIKSEDYNINDGFQGGSLLYTNSSLTPDANSNYRLLNRTPTQQNAKVNYTKDPYYGYEFLLANDVDNSNPIVQAEDLNWLYYLLNFGSITHNDPDANFDSLRIDAVENMNADILNIAARYFQDAYHMNSNDQNANNHLTILEDWSKNDAYYLRDNGGNQLTIDGTFLDAVQADLLKSPDQRFGLESLINTGLVDRNNDSTENNAIPNYSIVRAHDNGVQDVIAQIIKDKIDPKSNGFVLTADQLNRAFKIYDADQKQTNKKYTQYNIPSAYALMLTNKDTIPRVYYGDMYTDDGQFMANQTPYFASIDQMLKGRVKYVAGGQSMKVMNVKGDSKMPSNSYRGILTSVRYGKGALNASDSGDSTTRSSGIAVIESNNPNLKLASGDQVVINMGAAHKNQAYRPLINSTSNGLQNYANDSDAGNNIIYTNNQGQLILGASQVQGFNTPTVSGYLSMWVPVGAAIDQDVRTAPTTTPSTDGQSIHSNAALDSNLIFEGFSNFQAQPTTNDEYENVILPQKVNQFKNWGVTYIQLPPQYRSTDDNSFLDSSVKNGYAFNDRYDLGFNTPTKYGTDDQLINTIKAFHANGIKVMADFVPDQLYSLPNQQVVTAMRTNQFGQLTPGSLIYNTLYSSYTMGSNSDYQNKYGGEFLAKLQSMYPDIFTMVQKSNNHRIDPGTKIKQWEAKYFNGSNIQGRGAGYVLNSGNYKYYFNVNTNQLAPAQLLNLKSFYGFIKNGSNTNYYSTSGYQVKDNFVRDDNGNSYYFDADGNMVTGIHRIHGAVYYFASNGVMKKSIYYRDAKGQSYYFGANGAQYANNYYVVPGDPYQNYRYYDRNGVMAVGSQLINGNYQYFNDNGYQVKDEWRRDNKGNLRYYQPADGNAPINIFDNIAGKNYYFNQFGIAVTGKQKLYGNYMYFDKNSVQVKNQIVRVGKHLEYYDNQLGHLVINSVFNYNGLQYRADKNGHLKVIKK